MSPHLKQGLQDCVKGGRESDWMELDRMETEGEAGAASGVSLTSTSIMASSDSPVGVRRGWTALSGLWGDASWGEGERGDADGTTGDRVAGCADPTTGWSGILSWRAVPEGLAWLAQFPFQRGKQLVQAAPAFTQTQFTHLPLPLHRQQYGIVSEETHLRRARSLEPRLRARKSVCVWAYV